MGKYSIKEIIKGQDYLFNLAGQTSHLDSMENPFIDLDINAKAQLSILEACRKNNQGIRIVFASTRQIYGKPSYLPVDEKHPLHPVDINGINKIAGEQYHLLYHEVHGIASSVLRLTNTYGPRMRIKDARQTFLGVWIRNLLQGIPIGCTFIWDFVCQHSSRVRQGPWVFYKGRIVEIVNDVENNEYGFALICVYRHLIGIN